MSTQSIQYINEFLGGYWDGRIIRSTDAREEWHLPTEPRTEPLGTKKVIIQPRIEKYRYSHTKKNKHFERVRYYKLLK